MSEPQPETQPMTAREPEEIAKRFHDLYESYAPEFGYATRKDTAVPWEQVPEPNRKLMVKVCNEVTAALRQEIEQLKALRSKDFIDINKSILTLTTMMTEANDRAEQAEADLQRVEAALAASHEALRKYGSHTKDCAAGKSHVCTCDHLKSQHFGWEPEPCAHCECKAFTVGPCTCGFAAALTPFDGDTR